MDAARYKKHYAKIIAKSEDQTISPQSKDAANIKVLWQRLIEAYIRPNGSREINIPSEVRDPILHYDFTTTPPPPEALDVAVSKVYELMEESVLVPFLNTMSPPASSSPHHGPCDCNSPDEPESANPREDRFKFRKGRFAKHSPPSGSPTESPPIGFPPQQGFGNRKSAPMSLTTTLHRHRLSNRLSPTSSVNNAPQSASSNSGDPASLPGLTDDSGYTSSHTTESIMTPPMSPPDDDLALSPRSSREGGWKKFGRLSQWKPMKKKSQQNFAKDSTESMP